MEKKELTTDFKKYGSIENLSTLSFSKKVYSCFPKIGSEEFVVLEKAHGAHFSFQTDGQTITCGKRSCIIPENENFYNHMEMLDRYRAKIKDVYHEISNLFDKVTCVQIDGELIGGSYNHELVKPLGKPKVQKGVDYCPNYEFYAYDIKWINSNSNNESNVSKWKYINYDVCMDIFKKAGFYYSIPLERGEFKKIINFSPVFITNIPSLFGLPDIDSNYAEGVVLKPVEPLDLPDGKRVIFKNKNENFSETYTKREIHKIFTNSDPIDEEVYEWQLEMLRFVTVNRLNNVISKIGEVTMADLGKLTGILSKDAMEEFVKVNEDNWLKLDKPKQKMVTKKLAIHCRGLVTDYFMN